MKLPLIAAARRQLIALISALRLAGTGRALAPTVHPTHLLDGRGLPAGAYAVRSSSRVQRLMAE